MSEEKMMGSHRNVAVVVLSLLLIAGALPGPPRAQAQDVATDLAGICSAGDESIAIEERPQFLGAVPAGIMVTMLAHHPAQQLPEGTRFVLSLDSLTLAARNETKQRHTAGPTLFLVEHGNIAVVDSGRVRQLSGRPAPGPGESVLVERHRVVWLQNTGDEPGSVLLLGLLPPEGQVPIGPVGAPANIWIPFAEEREQLAHRQVLSGEVGALAREETLLFAACLHWTDPASEMTPMNYPGPVGLLVLRGQAVVNDTERIGAGSCWLSPSDTPLRIRAGEPAPDILLFGALRPPAQPQPATDGREASSSLDCAGPSAASDG